MFVVREGQAEHFSVTNKLAYVYGSNGVIINLLLLLLLSGREGVRDQPWLGSWADNVTVTMEECGHGAGRLRSPE